MIKTINFTNSYYNSCDYAHMLLQNTIRACDRIIDKYNINTVNTIYHHGIS